MRPHNMRHIKKSSEELRALWPTRLEKSAQSVFLATAVRVINKRVGIFSRRNRDLDFEEVSQYAFIKVIEAIKTWDPDRGSWFNHAAVNVDFGLRSMRQEVMANDRDMRIGQLKGFIQKRKPLPDVNSRLDAPLTEDGDRSLHEIYPADTEKPLQQQEFLEICHMSRRFEEEPRLRNYIRLVVLEGWDGEDFASLYEVSRQATNHQWRCFAKEVQQKLAQEKT